MPIPEGRGIKLVVVFVIIVLLATVGVEAWPLFKQNHPAADAPLPERLTHSQQSFLLDDVFDLAAREKQRNLVDEPYTDDADIITADGWVALPNNPDQEVLLIGVDQKKAFCIVGSLTSKKVWVLYDSSYRHDKRYPGMTSRYGGLLPLQWDNAEEPQAYCRDKRIKHFTELRPIPSTEPTTIPTAAIHLDPDPQRTTLTEAQIHFLNDALRAMASAEDRYRHRTGKYTNDGSALTKSGYAPARANPDFNPMIVGYNHDGYCIVGLATVNQTAYWSVYDSQTGGLKQASFTTARQAEQYSCSLRITNFRPVN